MMITGVNVEEACVLDCGQVVKPGDKALAFAVIIRCNDVAAYYLRNAILQALEAMPPSKDVEETAKPVTLQSPKQK